MEELLTFFDRKSVNGEEGKEGEERRKKWGNRY
jgi:hypothetical protein